MTKLRQGSNIGITLKSLLASWVTIIIGTSILIYLFASPEHKSYHPNPTLNSLRTIWEIGDEMGPVVKLSIIGIFGILVLLLKDKISKSRTLLYFSSISFAIISVLLVLAFLPANISRGYGVGLTGTRFEIKMTLIYLIGAISGGAVFAYVYLKLSRRKY